MQLRACRDAPDGVPKTRCRAGEPCGGHRKCAAPPGAQPDRGGCSVLSSQNPVIPDEIVMHSSCVVRPVPRFSGTSPANQIMDVNFPQNRPARRWCARRKRVALAGHGRDRGSVVGTRPPSRPHRHGFVARARESRIDRRDLLQILGIRSPVIERVRGGSAPHGPADPAGPLSVGDPRSLGQSACPRVATPVRAWGGSDPCGRTLQRQGSPALGRAGVGSRCGHVGVRIRQGPPSCSVFRLPRDNDGRLVPAISRSSRVRIGGACARSPASGCAPRAQTGCLPLATERA